MHLVVRRHIVTVQQRTEEIPLSQKGTLGSRASNYFPVFQALLVGNGSVSYPCLPLRVAQGIICHFKTHNNYG